MQCNYASGPHLLGRYVDIQYVLLVVVVPVRVHWNWTHFATERKVFLNLFYSHRIDLNGRRIFTRFHRVCGWQYLTEVWWDWLSSQGESQQETGLQAWTGLKTKLGIERTVLKFDWWSDLTFCFRCVAKAFSSSLHSAQWINLRQIH